MILLLAACTYSSRATSAAPFSLGKLKTALFAESRWSSPDSGNGSATLLLVDDASYGCSDLEAELNGESEPRDSITWKASGVLVDLEWWTNTGDNIGWEGEYWQGSYSYAGYFYYDYSEEGDGDQKTVSRRHMGSVAFADERVYQGNYLFGRLDVESGDAQTVSGVAETEWWKARFEAENCGQVGEAGPTDGEETRDTGDSD